MNRCKLCVMPDTRPDTEFVDGVCSACIAYRNRSKVDWEERLEQLRHLLERHDGRCIVPSSGGKDSHAQVLMLLELGAKVIVVTASTCQLTKIGRYNIENLKRYANTIEYSPNKRVRAILNRLGLELVGDISWPEHVSIFTTPFHAAIDLGIPLLFYGENPQNQYGGPLEAQEASIMTRRWVSEFGGFLGLRPVDLIGKEGLTEEDLLPYMKPNDLRMLQSRVEAHFLGHYIPWDSHLNADAARKAGMMQKLPTSANYWTHENLDNAQTGIHDHMMFRKYGYGRGAAQVSVDVRSGRLHREEALTWCKTYDGGFPYIYAGVPSFEVTEQIGMSKPRFQELMDKFTNWALFDSDPDLRRPG